MPTLNLEILFQLNVLILGALDFPGSKRIISGPRPIQKHVSEPPNIGH